jgi:hypothetical protein
MKDLNRKFVAAQKPTLAKRKLSRKRPAMEGGKAVKAARQQKAKIQSKLR